MRSSAVSEALASSTTSLTAPASIEVCVMKYFATANSSSSILRSEPLECAGDLLRGGLGSGDLDSGVVVAGALGSSCVDMG